jgi:ATP-dependent RNA helicase RhlE
VGRTGRAEATGDAFTFVAPEDEDDLRAIERAIGTRLPRVTVPDFDYAARPRQQLEIPLAQRIAEIRKRKREDRARAEINAARRGAAVRQGGSRSTDQARPVSTPRAERAGHPRARGVAHPDAGRPERTGTRAPGSRRRGRGSRGSSKG